MIRHGLAILALAGVLSTVASCPQRPSISVRVVSQTVGSDELLLALAEPGQIAALSHRALEPAFSAVADQAKAYPHLKSDGDTESILKYKPTLVLFANYSRAELVTQIRRAGVKTLMFDSYDSLDDAYANLRSLARELGPKAQTRADSIIADGRARVEALRKRLAGVVPVRVIAPSVFGMIPGAGTTFQDLCDHAGADNLATSLGHLRGHAPPPEEQMLTWPIDRVVLAGDDRNSVLARFREQPPYQFLPAIKEGRVAWLLPYQMSCVSHFRVEGYERLARELHPEAFR
jgi:iron complex transport system substrate-binding protein